MNRCRRRPTRAWTRGVDIVAVFADGTMLHAEGDWHESAWRLRRRRSRPANSCSSRAGARFEGVDDFAWTLTLSAREAGIQFARQRAFVADGDLAVEDRRYALSRLGTDSGLVSLGREGASDGRRPVRLRRCRGQRVGGRPQEPVVERRSGVGIEGVGGSTGRRRPGAAHGGIAGAGRVSGEQPNPGGLSDVSGPESAVRGGIVEGACKSLVRQRCKLSGMRNWRKESAEAVLRLRAAIQQGNFDLIWERLAA